jgi:hypothetical protein
MFGSDRESGAFNLYQKLANGAGDDERVLKSSDDTCRTVGRPTGGPSFTALISQASGSSSRVTVRSSFRIVRAALGAKSRAHSGWNHYTFSSRV